MGCVNSKGCCRGCFGKKKKSEAQQVKGSKAPTTAQDGSGKLPLDELGDSPEKQLEAFERQLKVLHGVLAASGSKERDALLKAHPHGNLCMLVHSIMDKMKADTVAELTAQHEDQVRTATEQHQIKLSELEQGHSEERGVLVERHREAETALKEQCEALAADLKSFDALRRRVEESTLKRDLQRNIQTQGSPGPFWEQEMESLLFVIEMKADRVQSQASKLLQMQELVEKNLSLEDKVVHVLQQNDDLRVRMENYQSLIQQLSKEQTDLQGRLDSQTLQCQKLKQEKEELLFKLLHEKEPCSSFRMSAIVPQASHS